MAKPDSSMVGVSKYERVENDWYPTEPACTLALYEYLVSAKLIYAETLVFEPACGDGAISKVFEQKGHKVISSDLYPQLEGAAVKDFLTSEMMFDRDNYIRPLMVTNPPYAMPHINDFIERTIALAKEDGMMGALLMRNEVDAAVGRRKYFEENRYYFGKLVLNWRPRWVPGSTGSPRHNYAWYLFGPPSNYPARIAYAKRPKV